MGSLSRVLRTYLKNPHVRRDAQVKVVVVMKAPASETLSRVSATPKSHARAMNLLRASGLSGAITKSATFLPKHILAGTRTVTVDAAVADLEKLAGASGVDYVRPVRLHKMHLDFSVPLLGVDAGVTKDYDGASIRVAVIDSGIDATHPDLKGRVRLDLSRNFSGEGSQTDVQDGNGHGTHVAGIIGGAGPKYRGVAPGVEFISCKVFDSKGRAGEEGAIQAAVRWAVEHGAHVINYSGGFSPIDSNGNLLVDPPWVWPLDLMEEEIEMKKAMDGGVIAVVSAGNEGEYGRRATLSMPATCSAVISVGATDKNKVLTSFSSVGPALRSPRVSLEDMVVTLTPSLKPSVKSFAEVDLLAPGGGVDRNAAQAGACFYTGGIISTLAKGAGDMEQVCFVDQRYVRLSGTSQAAPHITGMAALVLHAAQKLQVDLGPKRAYVVKGILRTACSTLSGYSKYEQGKGLPSWRRVVQLVQDLGAGKISLDKLARS